MSVEEIGRLHRVANRNFDLMVEATDIGYVPSGGSKDSMPEFLPCAAHPFPKAVAEIALPQTIEAPSQAA